ncbi:MAG TPA: (S)-ureidoglycine aminohydrolase [Pirellulales bacterium]|jgi:(S)-ureidoglycine aminohydrolase
MEPIRVLPFGTTRSRVASNFALITPDTHVNSPLVGWKNASAVIHIAPEMGARFTQYTATLEQGAVSARPGEGVERFMFVLEGTITLDAEGKSRKLGVGEFAFIPCNTQHQISTEAGAKSNTTGKPAARLAIFEKRYQPGGGTMPPIYIGNQKNAAGEPFQGDPALRLQTLLPIEPAFDMAVNVFTFDPGGHLPLVEIHVMEHGLLMLDGAGVYRLGDDHYFPVQTGDVIWMASYCPQWFVAMGKQPARYLYYKDIHRDCLNQKSY